MRKRCGTLYINLTHNWTENINCS